MKPFIFRYGKSQSLTAEDGIRSVQYCTQAEATILTEDFSLAIEHHDIGIKATGSLITEAQRDPTRDESTDR